MSVVAFLAQQTMSYSIPLMLAATGGLFSERSGVNNIALEGIMIVGAFTGILFIKTAQATHPGQWVLLAALLVAGIAGLALSALHAVAAIHLKADQIISGTALNILAPALCVFIARRIQTVQQISFMNTFMIEKVPVLGDLPVVGGMFFSKVYLTTYVGIAVMGLSALVLYKTRFGLRLRACGEHPGAAASLGVNVVRMRWAGVLISGFLAGAAGVVLIVPTTTSYAEDVSGYGFLALAVLIFGQWRPLRILFASFFFGLMKTLASSYTIVGFLASLGLPSAFYKTAPFLTTLVVLIFSSKNSQAPKAAGTPYEKDAR